MANGHKNILGGYSYYDQNLVHFALNANSLSTELLSAKLLIFKILGIIVY